MKIHLVALNICMLFPAALYAQSEKNAAEPAAAFSVKIESAQRDDKNFKIIVSVENTSSDFKPLFVQRPDEWGKTAFIGKHDGKSYRSSNATTYSQGSFTGLVFAKGDKFTFVYEGVAEEGEIHFKEAGERLRIYADNVEISVKLTLFVSEFTSGKCYIERLQSDWKRIDYPFPTAKLEANSLPDEERELPELPELPR